MDLCKCCANDIVIGVDLGQGAFWAKFRFCYVGLEDSAQNSLIAS